MTERRIPKVKIGRRKTDIPIAALERFKDEMKKHVEQSVDKATEKYVNGGIRGIKKQIDDYILEDTKWKEDAKPAIDNMKNLRTGWRVALGFFGGMAIISGGIFAIKKLLGL